MLNGHIQISVSLKNRDDIKQAISLLESVLVEDTLTKDIAEVRKSFSPGTFVVSNKTKIKPVVLKPFPQTIEEKEEFLKKADPKEFKKYYDETYTKPISDKKKALQHKRRSDTAKKSMVNHRRDKKTGHFLPGKVSK